MWRSFIPVSFVILGLGCSTPTAEDTAARFVTRLGGMVTRDMTAPGEPVVGVHMRDTVVTDADLKQLAPCTQLASLDLSKTRITDAGLKELMQFKHLKSLGLRETQITDAGLKELTKIPSLTSLYIGGAQVTDAGIKDFLREMPNCELTK